MNLTGAGLMVSFDHTLLVYIMYISQPELWSSIVLYTCFRSGLHTPSSVELG